MEPDEFQRLRSIKTFPSLVKYLRDELDWPIESEDFEDLTFDYEPDELGINAKTAVKINNIKQLRPLSSNQPWGIFFVNFAPKRLPVVVLRRVLQSLVIKKRQSANKATQVSWLQTDLLFISSYGESEDRAITFAHFTENKQIGDLPVLKVLGWDKDDTAFHLADAHDSLKEKLSWPDDEDDIDNWRQSWSSAFILRHREVVDTSKKLAIELADLAINIRRRVNQVLVVEDTEKGPMRKLMAGFKEALIHDLSEDDFADMYAQTIAYGLLAAAISRHVPGEGVALIADNIADMVPVTNPFLKELLGTFLTVGGRKNKLDFDELGVNDIIDLLRNANLTAVLHDFGNQNPFEDPVIHFYELFLKEYDAKKRTQRGIFYTPKPVVSFIVRSVHEILRNDFGLEDGLADITTWGEMAERNKDMKIPSGVNEDEPFVQILDPATGTGTFLVEAIDVIYRVMIEKWGNVGHMPLEFSKLWNEYVPKHLLQRLYGFELLMAPYTIAHMKIGLKLKKTGYSFQTNERVRVYLTNTLEEPKDISGYFEQMAPALAHEAKAANKVKDKTPISVVIGNPPYAVGSSNKGEWIQNLIADYKKELNEKKLNIDDDYIKFIRHGEYCAEKISGGILAFISNNSFIDGVTHRQMRKHLLNTFESIYILDLHGSSKKKETALDGSKDENVFDIMQGVSVNLFVKSNRNRKEELATVSHSDLYGLRKLKYSCLLKKTINTLSWSNVGYQEPYFFFVPKDFGSKDTYNSFVQIIKLYKQHGSGLITDRDNLFFDENIQNLGSRISLLLNGEYDLEFENKYRVVDSSGYNLTERIKKFKFDPSCIQKCYYRPFDKKFLYYQVGLTSRPGYDNFKHIIEKKNIALLVKRQFVGKEYSHVLISDCLNEVRYIENAFAHANVFPLYLYPEENSLASQAGHLARTPNLNMEVIDQLAERLGLQFTVERKEDRNTFAPIDILDYIYAVLYSPAYREKYKEFRDCSSNTEFFNVSCVQVPMFQYRNLNLCWRLSRCLGQATM